ncbi:glycosyltransferase family 2 protein [Granulibacter bethesdensis]|uniref:glycosyltransferase family 2 protein n=1 Tax=Granulibacter bethesdensis TaxID=364410 RepID=UPI0003F1D904|nr:glycosyltransferase family 2 protein [Granulibacter bethesdensis]APG30675.1 putative membrane spanning protein [Granulibacter bethesdensis]
MKTAVAAIFKNEEHDILSWIAWYINVGFDTLILFNDSSTDRSRSILSECALRYDIRIIDVPPTDEYHIYRQKNCYIETLNIYKDEFDWIGFFDLDEYLFLNENETLHHFLDRPEDVGALAIHWCCYGPNNYLFKPKTHPFVAFDKHFPASQPINRHVKTLLRPKAWTGKWDNVHYFEVAPYRYVNACGKEISWADPRGITSTEADFTRAKILHFQCRSLEQFLARLKKRPDVPQTITPWLGAQEMATVYDPHPGQLQSRIEGIIYEIQMAVVKARMADIINSFPHHSPLEKTIFKYNLSSPVSIFAINQQKKAENKIDFFSIKTFEGYDLGYDTINRCFRNGPIGENILPVIGAIFAEHPFMVHLIVPGAKEALLQINGDPRKSKCLRYERVNVKDHEGIFYLRHPDSKFFICCEPPYHGGKVTCSRTEPKSWEEFSLLPLEDHKAPRNIEHSFVQMLQNPNLLSNESDIISICYQLLITKYGLDKMQNFSLPYST